MSIAKRCLLALAVLLCLCLSSAEAQALPLSGLTVCLDPGHTSETSAGTASRDGKLTERHVNWLEALRLRPLLQAAGARVVMTKLSEGQIVPNRRRAEIANAAHADLLLRLHCDSNAPSGITTYYPDRQGTRFGVTGPSQAIIARSQIAAGVFQPAVAEVLRGALPDGGIKGDSATFVGGRQGALTGSIFAQVPALTVEMCVLTNTHDYAFIRTPSGQEKMAQALFAGVSAFASSLHSHRAVSSAREWGSLSLAIGSKERTMSTLEQQHQHLHEVHEHLKYASTSDAPEEIRERLRRAELALQRHEQQAQSEQQQQQTAAA